MEYDAFISYSRASDGEFAPRLRADVRRMLRRWWGASRLSIFLDRASLVPGGSLSAGLRERIEASRYFVLLASPASAQSTYVGLEVSHWLALHGTERLLLVLTEGELDWRDGAFTASSVVPPVLREAFREAPLHLDLRAFHTEQGRARAAQQYREELAGLAARIAGRTKEWVIGEERRRKRTVATLGAAVFALLSTLGVVAVRSAAGRRVEARRALANSLLQTAVEQITERAEFSARLALEAHALAPGQRVREIAADAVEAMDLERKLAAHLGAVRGIEFSSDGATLITAGAEGLAKVWSWPALELRGELRGHEQALVRAVLSPQGEHACTLAFDRSVCLWRVRDSKLIQRLPTPFGVADPTLEFAGDALWVSSARGGARGFALESGLELDAPARWSELDPLSSAVRSDDARYELRWDARGAATLFELASPREPFAQFTGVSNAAFRPGGQQLALCDRPDRVLLLEAQRPQAGAAEVRVEAPAAALEFSRDGRWLTVVPAVRGVSSAAAQLGVVLYDCELRAVHWVLRPRTSVLTAVAFTPDSNGLLVGSAKGELILKALDPVLRAEQAQPPQLLASERKALGLDAQATP